MSSESEQVLKVVFDKADTNGSGTIDMKELVCLIRAAGETITRNAAEDLMKEFDKDENGTLDFQEFANMMKSYMAKGGHQPQTEKEKIFALLDHNKDGVISFTELKAVMNDILKEGLTDEQLHDMLKKADTDSDGVISFDEFNKLASELKIFHAS